MKIIMYLIEYFRYSRFYYNDLKKKYFMAYYRLKHKGDNFFGEEKYSYKTLNKEKEYDALRARQRKFNKKLPIMRNICYGSFIITLILDFIILYFFIGDTEKKYIFGDIGVIILTLVCILSMEHIFIFILILYHFFGSYIPIDWLYNFIDDYFMANFFVIFILILLNRFIVNFMAIKQKKDSNIDLPSISEEELDRL